MRDREPITEEELTMLAALSGGRHAVPVVVTEGAAAIRLGDPARAAWALDRLREIRAAQV